MHIVNALLPFQISNNTKKTFSESALFLKRSNKALPTFENISPTEIPTTRMSSMQEYPQDFINSQETSSNLLGFYFVDKVDKDPPFLSLNRCLPMLKNNGFISQIIDESENWVIVKSRHL